MEPVYKTSYYFGTGDKGKAEQDRIVYVMANSRFKSISAVLTHCVQFAMTQDPELIEILKKGRHK